MPKQENLSGKSEPKVELLFLGEEQFVSQKKLGKVGDIWVTEIIYRHEPKKLTPNGGKNSPTADKV